MSLYLKKLASLGAMVAVMAALLCAAPAEAAITIAISTDGGATFTTSTAAENAKLFTAPTVTTAGGTDISVTASTNQPLGANFAQVSQTQINVSGNSPDLVLLVVRVSDIDFALPVGASTLSSSFSGSIGLGTIASTGTFQSVADFNNGVLFGGLPGVPGSAPPASEATTGLQPVLVTPNLFTTSSFSGDAAITTVSTAPFSLSNEFRFDAVGSLTGLAIGTGGVQFTFTGTTTLTPVPAPAGVMLALTALPLLGFGHWLRRRKSEVKPV